MKLIALFRLRLVCNKSKEGSEGRAGISIFYESTEFSADKNQLNRKNILPILPYPAWIVGKTSFLSLHRY